MSKYHIHLMYAISFAMQHTNTETNVHMNKDANHKQKGSHELLQSETRP